MDSSELWSVTITCSKQMTTMENLAEYLKRHLRAGVAEDVLKDVIIDAIIVDEHDFLRMGGNAKIIEAKTSFNQIPGAKYYTYRFDRPFGEQKPGNQGHFHIFKRGDELFAINVDGTGHDGCHKIRIPDDIVPFLKDKGVVIPKDQIIEMLTFPQNATLLNESQVSTYDCTKIAIDMGGIMRRASDLTLIIGNVETYQVKMHSKVISSYHHVNKLYSSDRSTILSIKELLEEQLSTSGIYSRIDTEIFDDSYHPTNLFVAWNEPI